MPAPALLEDLFKFLMARPGAEGRQVASFSCKSTWHCGERERVGACDLSKDPGHFHNTHMFLPAAAMGKTSLENCLRSWYAQFYFPSETFLCGNPGQTVQ